MKHKIFVLFLFYVVTSTTTKSESTFVDPNVILQTNFKGWGTSLAWWADMVGGMDQEIFDHVVDALFSPTKLNLNIARYVIGGTTPDNHTCGEYRDGAATESFRDGPDSEYKWDRDMRQRKVLEAAKAKGANLFEAFSNTPPQWLTISGCSKGNPGSIPLHSNFDTSNAAAFADYATEVIKYFNETLNITFSTYSPFNEPYGLGGIGSWVGEMQSQEGCNMNRLTMAIVIENVYAAITAKNLDFVKIAVSDETQVNTQIQVYDYFMENGVGDKISQVNVHGYWDNVGVSRRDLLSLKCRKRGHDLWMDEMGWGGTPSNNMEQALNLANRIVLDLRNMMPSAWVYWQAVEGGGGWGLMEVPYVDTSLDKIVINSGYYGLGHFSKHIKAGYQLISISNKNSVAAFSSTEKKLVIVAVNPTNETITHELDLGLFNSLKSPVLYRTSSTEQHLNVTAPSVNTNNKVTIDLSAETISTLEFSDVEIVGKVNLIQNGDFEAVDEGEEGILIPTSWELIGEYAGLLDDNAWEGQHSGSLQIGSGRAPSLIQNVTLSGNASTTTCTLYLSAWCSSSQLGTKLGININGRRGSEVSIAINGAYSSYGFSFSANPSDIIQVYFTNPGSFLSGIAKIDEVFLHSYCYPKPEDNGGGSSKSSIIFPQSVYLYIVYLFSCILFGILQLQ